MKPTKTPPAGSPTGTAPKAETQNQAQAPQAATQIERKVRPMEAPRFRGVEFVRNEWLCTAFEHTTPQDLLDPAYWAHLSSQMKPRDRVEAWADDGTWMAEYVVLESGRTWARLHCIAAHHFTTADQARTQADAMSPYAIEFRGPHNKWSVIRKTDREVMHEGEETVRAATEWLEERMKAEK